MADEPSLESTRDALVGYLEELGEQAQITTVAICDHRQKIEAGQGQRTDRTLYVVGRTPDTPYRYFVRSCAHFGDETMFWSGWEALELDNANDYLMPFFFEGDLHIAWPTFRSAIDEAATDENARRQWEVQLAWARRSARGWTKRKSGKQVMLTKRLVNKTPENSFTFRVSHAPLTGTLDEVASKAIQIACYAASTTEPEDLSKFRVEFTTGEDLRPTDLREFNWHNAWVVISCIVKGKFQPQGEPKPLFDDLKDVTLTLDYSAYETDNNGQVATVNPKLVHWNGNFEAKTEPKIGLWVQRGSVIGATFTREGSPPQTRQTKKLEGDAGEKYVYWSLDFTVVFDVGQNAPSGALAADRAVTFEHAGAFSFDSLRDVAVWPANGEKLRLMFEGVPLARPPVKPAVVGNGFGFESLASTLPVPAGAVTSVDRGLLTGVTIIPAAPFGPTPGALAPIPQGPLVMYLRDDKRRFFLSVGNGAPFASPDGQAYVVDYRRLTAASTFGIFTRDVQSKLLDKGGAMPTPNVLRTVNSAISFHRRDTYANYNWELFLHLPLSIADHLARHQRFEDARRWLHAVFDPTAEPQTTEGPRFWKFLPFDNASRPEAIAKLLAWLVDPNINDPDIEADLKAQIDAWRRNPFMPHLIARLRPSAYQWHRSSAWSC